MKRRLPLVVPDYGEERVLHKHINYVNSVMVFVGIPDALVAHDDGFAGYAWRAYKAYGRREEILRCVCSNQNMGKETTRGEEGWSQLGT